MAIEIERKFRLSDAPPHELLGEGIPIEQGYLTVSPGELRLRRKGDTCFLTVKGDGTIARDEWEVEIPVWVFSTLWPSTLGRRIQKTRYSMPCAGATLEIDVFEGDLAGLFVLECEFPSEEVAAIFRLPSWASSALEVTGDLAYKNKSLAVRGLPRETS